MSEQEPSGKARVFLLMPFEAELDELQAALNEAAEDAGVEMYRADDIFAADIVVDQIKAAIRGCDAVVAVCTPKNPNVFYELGLAEDHHKPILVAASADDLPFDVKHFRAHMYGGTTEGKDDFNSLKPRVARAILETLQARSTASTTARSESAEPSSEPIQYPISVASHGVGFSGGTSRPFLQMSIWSANPSPDRLTDDVLEAAERWFKRVCPSAVPVHASPSGLFWKAEDDSHSPTARWLGWLEPGPWARVDEEPRLRALPTGDLDIGWGQPSASLLLQEATHWWRAQLAEAREFLEKCGVEQVSGALALQTLPIQPFPRIVSIDFGGSPTPPRGAEPDQVPVWVDQFGPLPTRDLGPGWSCPGLVDT